MNWWSDLIWLLGVALSVLMEMAQTLLPGRCASWIDVAMNAAGAALGLRGGPPEEPGSARTLRIPAAKLRTEALDPTGVGDAFRSGLVASRLRGLPWEEAGRVCPAERSISERFCAPAEHVHHHPPLLHEERRAPHLQAHRSGGHEQEAGGPSQAAKGLQGKIVAAQ